MYNLKKPSLLYIFFLLYFYKLQLSSPNVLQFPGEGIIHHRPVDSFGGKLTWHRAELFSPAGLWGSDKAARSFMGYMQMRGYAQRHCTSGLPTLSFC